MAKTTQGPPGSGAAILWTVVAESLDPAYRQHHTTTQKTDQPQDQLVPTLNAATVGTLAALLALGLSFGFAVNYLGSRGETTRSALKSKVLEQRQLLAERENDVAALDRQVAVLTDDTLGTASSKTSWATQHLASAVAVQGPGLVVVLSDPSGNANTSASKAKRIMDSDVQLVVNELWAGGAEAIVVNGQRLSATTAIREAGDVILVNYSPVQSPYRIAAIGPAAQMREQLNSSAAAKLLDRLARTTGVSWKSVPVDRVEAPAANVLVGKTRGVVADPQPGP